MNNELRIFLILFFINFGSSQNKHLSMKYVNPLTKNQIHNLNKWNPRVKQNFWELSGQFQGDIILTPATWNEMRGSTSASKWPNGTIPYVINRRAYNIFQQFQIRNTLKLFEKYTCVKVVPKQPNDKDYVFITGAANGICASEVGKTGGKQTVFLSPPSCLHKGRILHEFFHVFGFFHQQSSPDRDKYIKINWKNIYKKNRMDFAKLSNMEFQNFDVPYDYNSIMHYSAFAFAVNASIPTVISPEPIGNRERLSEGDKIKINRMYGCDPNYCNPNYCRKNPSFCPSTCVEDIGSNESFE